MKKRIGMWLFIVIIMVGVCSCGVANKESFETIANNEENKEKEMFQFDLEPDNIKKAIHLDGLYGSGVPGSEENEKLTHEIKQEYYNELCQMVNKISKIKYDEKDDQYILRNIIPREFAISIELLNGKGVYIDYDIVEKEKEYYRMGVLYNENYDVYLADEEWVKEWREIIVRWGHRK